MKEHKARKRFGQNFLQDTRIISDIVNAVRPQPDDIVIEIGPGLAAITEPLAKKNTVNNKNGVVGKNGITMPIRPIIKKRKPNPI